MATPNTRAEFKDYCLRKLGHPVIEINVDDDQIDDRIDEALQFFYDYHWDGVEKIFMKHRVQQADIDRGWIYVPEAIISVTNVFPFDESNSSINMFDLRYQLRLHDLYDFTSVSYVSYEITMQHIQTLNLLFSGKPQFRFNRHMDRLMLDIDWTRDLQVGQYFVMECYRKLDPDVFTVTGTAELVTGNATIIGTNTTFDRDLIEGDEVSFNTGESYRVKKLISPTEIILSSNVVTASAAATMTKPGISDVWNDRFLKKYAAAKIKYQWGTNLSKFAGIQLPGGVTLDGPRIMAEAQAEIDKIEEEMFNYNSLPSEIFVG
jgi:hypothetical protein